MGFTQEEAEKLLAETGRKCCICGRLHGVQLQHIVPPEEGGSDHIDNALPLCPNCHDEVHSHDASGRVTSGYTSQELKLHRKRTTEQIKKARQWSPGNAIWKTDRDLIRFYAQCLDSTAFRTYFHQETSFLAFDKAMEQTVMAINTGHWTTRDGTVIDRAKGKIHVTHQPWREKLDQIVEMIENIRKRFAEAIGADRMLYEYHDHGFLTLLDERLRDVQSLGQYIDEQRQQVLLIINSILEEIGSTPLRIV